ncbi:MAG: TraR/DksA family transcriptional regulator [Desulfovibrio sp.]
MPDLFDRAQELEALERKAALSQAGVRPGRGPEWINGVACCRECGEPIPAARINALPGCERCVACQEAADSAGISRPLKNA